MSEISRILMVPGLLEPPAALWPLRYALRGAFEAVDIWQDRWVMRRLDESVGRLANAISPPEGAKPIGLVTHSFGDWVARAAIARAGGHHVQALVSLAPVMQAGFLPLLAGTVTGKWVPELAVINDPQHAAANLDCDPEVRRLVIWSRFDESLQPVDLESIDNLTVRHVLATHMTIICQPNVFQMVREFLLGEDGSIDQQDGFANEVPADYRIVR